MSPREEFQKSPMAKDFLAMTDTAVFRRAVEVTRLQLQYQTPPLNDGNAAIAEAFRAEGARRALDMLSTLANLKAPEQRLPTGNLKHI